MGKNANFVSHKKSKQKNQDGSPKLPLASALVEGEIAINFAENVETLSILNESGDVVTFSSDNYYSEKKLGSGFTGANSAVTVTDVIVENEEIVSTALNDLNDRIDNLDLGNEVEVNSGDTPSGQTIELWIDESITPIEAEVYTKNETSGATQISTALEGKVDVSAYTSYTSSTATEIGSKAAQSDLTTLSGTVTGHTADTTIHLTSTEKEQLHTHGNKSALDSITGNVGTMAYEDKTSYSSATEVNTALGNKANTSDLDNFFDDAKYEDSGTTKVINFYHGNTIKATVDASDFIVDGMVESVSAVTSGNTTVLDIKWNTAAGGQETIVDIGDIFEADNYYTKSETSGATELTTAFSTKANTATTLAGYGITDAYTKSETSGATEISNALEGKVNTSDIVSAITPSNSGSTAPIATKVVAENELVMANALIDLDDRKLDASAYTPTDLSNYYTKSQTSGASEISTALAGKSDTGHTHVSSGVTAMTGYAKAASGSSITTSDTLNQAIGKLEAYVDDLNSQSETIAAALVDLYNKIGDIETLLSQI